MPQAQIYNSRLCKTCSTCGVGFFEPERWFNKDKQSKDGLNHRCQECSKEYIAQWHDKHRDDPEYKRQNIERAQDYRNENPERVKDAYKNWCDANRERISENGKKYYELHRAEIRERNRQYHEEHKNDPAYRQSRSNYSKKYGAKNREKLSAYMRERRTKQGGSGYSKHLALILEMDGPCCGDNPIGGIKGCGIDLTTLSRDDIHVDHILPVARGGTNDLDNLQALCAKCNLSAVDKTVQEFVENVIS